MSFFVAMTFFYPVRSTHRLTFPYSKTCGEIGQQGFAKKYDP